MFERVKAEAEPVADRTNRSLAAWSMLAGLVLLAVLAGPFFAGRIYTADDLGAFHLPLRAFYAEQLAHGESYDWMPQLFSGFYLTGEGQAGVYHPLHQILYRLLPLRAALGWEYLLPYPMMMIGAWLLARRRLGRDDAAMLGALLFTFCSFNLLHFVHPNAIAIIAHIPWLLWAIDVALCESRRWRVALAVALIALLTGSQLLLGYPQFVWFSLVAELTYLVFLQTAHKHAARLGCDLCDTCADCVGCTTRTWPRVLVAKAVGLLIGGIQLLPSMDAWLHSARQAADPDFAFWGSLHPLNVLQLVAPYMFTGRVLGDSTHEYGLYAGAVPLILIAWLWVRRDELGPLRPLALTATGFGLVMLVLSFGDYGVLYRVMAWLPVFRSIRFPCRYLVLFQLAIAALAAIGFALLVRQCETARRQRLQGARLLARDRWSALWLDFEPLWYVVGFSVAVAVAGIKLRHEPYIASIPMALVGPVVLMAATLLVIAAVRGHSGALVGLILLATADMGAYGLSSAVYARSARLDAFIASACTPPGTPDGRVITSLLRVDEGGQRTGDLMTLRGWSRADGYVGLEPQRQLDYHLLPALRVAGVRWVRSDASTEQITQLKPYNSGWREVPEPLPRVRLVTRTCTGKAADITQIDANTTALCELPLALPPSHPGTAEMKADRPGRLEIAVECPAPQLLVVAESYHSGWQATVDARPQHVYRVNGDFMGCLVGPGKHQVVLSFRPISLQRGWLTSCIGLSMLAICFVGSVARPQSRLLMDDVL
jgi:hypothetical protein